MGESVEPKRKKFRAISDDGGGSPFGALSGLKAGAEARAGEQLARLRELSSEEGQEDRNDAVKAVISFVESGQPLVLAIQAVRDQYSAEQREQRKAFLNLMITHDFISAAEALSGGTPDLASPEAEDNASKSSTPSAGEEADTSERAATLKSEEELLDEELEMLAERAAAAYREKTREGYERYSALVQDAHKSLSEENYRIFYQKLDAKGAVTRPKSGSADAPIGEADARRKVKILPLGKVRALFWRHKGKMRLGDNLHAAFDHLATKRERRELADEIIDSGERKGLIDSIFNHYRHPAETESATDAAENLTLRGVKTAFEKMRTNSLEEIASIYEKAKNELGLKDTAALRKWLLEQGEWLDQGLVKKVLDADNDFRSKKNNSGESETERQARSQREIAESQARVAAIRARMAAG